MIAKILIYEIKNRFTHWTIFLFYALLIFQGIWYTKGTFDLFVNEDLLMNAPVVFYQNLAGGGILMIIIVAVITGPVLYKEIQYKTGQWLFTNPLPEKRFFFSRFLAAFSINALLGLGYIIGMLLVPYVGIAEAYRFGSAPLWQLLHGYVILLLPNLLLLTSSVFFALVYSRKLAAGYLAVIVYSIAFLVVHSTYATSGATPVLLIADPFAYSTVDHAIQQMSVEQRNYGYLSISNYLLVNRLLWLSFSSILLFLAYRKFSFKGFLRTPSGKPAKNTRKESLLPKIETARQDTEVFTSFTQWAFAQKMLTLSLLELKDLVRSTGFRVIVGVVVVMNILQNILWNSSFFIGETQPLTFIMTAFRLSFSVFMFILLMVWAGELFFKDRSANIWQITDALPVPTWTVTLSRYIAMVMIALFMAFTLLVVGIIVQLIRGGAGLIDWELYAYDMLGYNFGWLTYILMIAMAFFLAGLTKNRFVTHITSVGIFLLLLLSYELGLAEEISYFFPVVPGPEDYSEMNGHGIWKISAPWYFLMWAFLAVIFILGGVWLWQRGSHRKWWQSFSFINPQLSWKGKVLILVALAGFFVTRSHIFKQVNGFGNFTPLAVEERESADYERTYAYIKDAVQPKYHTLDLEFDFYPGERKAVYRTEIRLRNGTGIPIDTLYLNWEEFVKVKKLNLNDAPLESAWFDETSGIGAYRIPPLHRTDSIFSLQVVAEKQYRGFTQSGDAPQPDLMFNGSFGSVRQFLPIIGYKSEMELAENRKRQDHGLKKLDSRMASVDDPVALKQDAHSPDAEWVEGKLLISTSAAQTAIAPGRLVNEWQEDDRNYFQFEVIEPQPFNWHLGSAKYAAERVENHGVNVRLLFDPKHRFNIELYFAVASKAVRFVQDNFGDFPHDQVRIYEIPFHQQAFYNFSNAIAISEKEGWYALTSDIKARAYIYQTVAAQVVTQWVNATMKIADVQGADMLKVALPEALALHLVRQELGKEAVDHLLEKKHERYVMDKNNEPNQEPSLLFADGADYLEVNKGAKALYELSKAMDLAEFAKAVNEWILMQNGEYSHFKSLYDHLLMVLGPEVRQEVRKYFEGVV
ncbi:MAG: ABC-2 transporter permease [Bacteroidota bacterium]